MCKKNSQTAISIIFRKSYHECAFLGALFGISISLIHTFCLWVATSQFIQSSTSSHNAIGTFIAMVISVINFALLFIDIYGFVYTGIGSVSGVQFYGVNSSLNYILDNIIILSTIYVLTFMMIKRAFLLRGSKRFLAFFMALLIQYMVVIVAFHFPQTDFIFVNEKIYIPFHHQENSSLEHFGPRFPGEWMIS